MKDMECLLNKYHQVTDELKSSQVLYDASQQNLNEIKAKQEEERTKVRDITHGTLKLSFLHLCNIFLYLYR